MLQGEYSVDNGYLHSHEIIKIKLVEVDRDAANFNAQYPTLTVRKTQVFHDRFIILDGKTAYHIGASIKDAGKKCFGISLLEDSGLVTDL